MPKPLFNFPSPIDGDDESVAWALATAASLHGRGDVAGSIKWLRRAAEAASEGQDEARAVRLFRAAAELADLHVSDSEAERQLLGTEATQPRMYAIDVQGAADPVAPTDPAGALAYQAAQAGQPIVGHSQPHDEITLVPFTKKAAGLAPIKGATHENGGTPSDKDDTITSLPPVAATDLLRDDTMASAATFRVLVLASGEDGAPRVLRLGSKATPPEGAAAAVLVPNSSEDAALIRQMLSNKG